MVSPQSPVQSPVLKDLNHYAFPTFDPNETEKLQQSPDKDRTLEDEYPDENVDRNRLRVHTSYDADPGHRQQNNSPMSPYEQMQQSQQIDDELEMLRAESNVQRAQNERGSMSRTRSLHQTRSRTNIEPEDDFDIGTTPIYEQTKVYQPPAKPTTKFAKFFIKIHQSSFLVRYFCYIIPVSLILLIPLLLGAIAFKDQTVGGVELMWFCIWLEIVWLTLWLGRIIAKCIPYPMGVISSIFSNEDKLWRDLGKQLEVPISLFFWGLAVEISFLPTMTNHHRDGNKSTRSWENTMNKVIISIFVCATLNFVEKIIIQLIAISFHLRTYADRIEINKFQTSSLVKLYIYSKEKIAMKDSEFETPYTVDSSGLRTPLKYINKAGKGARQALHKVGDVAGRVAGDFTGREVSQSTHPQQVVIQLLGSTSGSQILARRLYRTFTPEDADTVADEDLRPAFDNNEEADAAFGMFDKDMNGDISMEELEAVCVEIGRERKAITASLKDLDSVVSKLDDLFLFFVAVISILVFITLISTSAAGVLTSAGSAVLALSWLFSATAQEVLQSIVFVFIKHPFDVGDRVTIYGNTGALGTGDDYFVKEIALLFTEFKKMEGHVVQAPNSYLNTLFILNQRRSGGLAEAVPVTMKFGTTIEQLEGLRVKLLEFVGNENREYQPNILTELRTVYEAYSINMNVVFFYKSNWQNELLRLQRRNKFICALMVSMQDLGIEGPRRTWAGQNAEAPVYMHSNVQTTYTPPVVDHAAPGPSPTAAGPGPKTGSLARQEAPDSPELQPSAGRQSSIGKQPSILRMHSNTNGDRNRKESLGQMSKRVDFSLGMSSISSGADMGDVYEKPKVKVPRIRETSPSPERRSGEMNEDASSLGRTTSRDSASTADMGRSRSRKFFGRKGKMFGASATSREREDLEAAVGGRRGESVMPMQEVSREHLAGIPETEAMNRRDSMEARMRDRQRGRSGSGKQMPGDEARIHPRTGMVNRQAVVSDEVDYEYMPQRNASNDEVKRLVEEEEMMKERKST